MYVAPLRMLIRDSIVWNWAREDPIATLEWMLTRDDRETGLLVQVPLSVLTGRDPEKAITLPATVPQTHRYHAADAVLGMLASRDLDRALGLFATLLGEVGTPKGGDFAGATARPAGALWSPGVARPTPAFVGTGRHKGVAYGGSSLYGVSGHSPSICRTPLATRLVVFPRRGE